MIKKVKIYVSGMPITLSDSIKAIGFHGPMDMSTEDIFRCLAAGAIVKEVLKGGKEIKLTFSNFDKINTPIIAAKATSDKQEVVKESEPQVTTDIESDKKEDIVEEAAPHVDEVVMPSNSMFISGEQVSEEEAVGSLEEDDSVEELTEESSDEEDTTDESVEEDNTSNQAEPQHTQYQYVGKKNKNRRR